MRAAVLALMALLAGGPVAAEPVDPADWVGKYTFDLLTAPDWQDKLMALMGRADLEALRNATGISEPIALRDGWLIGTGCAPHDCGFTMGGVGIAVETGQVVAVIADPDGRRIWGGAEADLPPALRRLSP